MNITFLIGNGFDINAGMKAGYKDFYEYYKKYYKKSPTNNRIINSFIKAIEHHEKWSDLELGLGLYVKRLKNLKEFDLLFEDIQKKLAFFLQNETKKTYRKLEKAGYDFDEVQSEIFSCLNYPERSLSNVNDGNIKQYKEECNWSEECNINIISFNYSKMLEKLLKYNDGSIKYRKVGKSHLREIKHIHGYLDNKMVLGVNDISQISDNVGLKNNEDLLDTLIKPRCNKRIGDLDDVCCMDLLEKSDLICLFGLSIGATDKIWWEAIGEQVLKRNCKLIIFYYCDDKIDSIHQQKNFKKEDEVTNKFLSQANVPERQWGEVRKKIIVGYNTSIFDITSEIKKEQLLSDEARNYLYLTKS